MIALLGLLILGATHVSSAHAAPDQCPPGDQCGPQTCNFSYYIAPHSFVQPLPGCGANNWRQIQVDFTFYGGAGCATSAGASVGFAASGAQAFRCNSGHASASQSGAYGDIFAYNTSNYSVIANGFVST